jgi:excisionase family DNA binding protein
METQSSSVRSEERLMTEGEVCEYLRIKPRQLYAWRIHGFIPYIKIGRALRFRRAEVEAALDRMSIGPS